MVEQLPTNRFTWADIEDLPDDGLRREIIGGSLIVTPAPFVRHQVAAFRLATILEAARPRAARVIVSPIDWRYDAVGVVQPDVVVLSEPVDLDGPIPADVRPVLVVEVLSTNAIIDRTVKRELYERLGVPSYWLLDPGAADRPPSVVALGLGADHRYRSVAEATGSDELVAEDPFAVSFSPAALLRP